MVDYSTPEVTIQIEIRKAMKGFPGRTTSSATSNQKLIIAAGKLKIVRETHHPGESLRDLEAAARRVALDWLQKFLEHWLKIVAIRSVSLSGDSKNGLGEVAFFSEYAGMEELVVEVDTVTSVPEAEFQANSRLQVFLSAAERELMKRV